MSEAYTCPNCRYQTVADRSRTCPECGYCGDWIQPGEESLYNGDNERLGNALIELLGLKVKPNKRVDTSWGDKTPMGLGATVRRLMRKGE